MLNFICPVETERRWLHAKQKEEDAVIEAAFEGALAKAEAVSSALAGILSQK